MNTRVLIVGLVAAGSIAAAAWSGVRTLSPRKVVSAESMLQPSVPARGGGSGEYGAAGPRVPIGGSWSERADEAPPPWMASVGMLGEEFPALLGTGAEVLDQQATAFEASVTNEGSLGALGGAPRSGLVESWRRLMRPVVAQDEAAFHEAVRSFGTDGASDDGSPAGSSLYRAMSGLLGGAVLDLSRVRTRRADAGNGQDVPRLPTMPDLPGVEMKTPRYGVPMMRVGALTLDESGQETQTSAALLPMQAVFPHAARAAEAGGPVVEVFSPIRVPGSKARGADGGVSAFFVWNAGDRQWQPLSARFVLVSNEGRQRLGLPGGRGGTPD